MQDFIIAKREQIAELCRTHHVRSLSIFGSALREDFDPARSDVDVIVEFDEMPLEEYSDNKWSLHDHLVAIFQREVDLLTWQSVRNPYIRDEIEHSHEMLYAA